MSDILFGPFVAAKQRIANIIAHPVAAQEWIEKNANTTADAGKSATRLMADRYARQFFPEDVQEELRRGTKLLGKHAYYGTAMLGSLLTVNIFDKNQTTETGVRNVKDGITDADKHFIVTHIRLLSSTGTTQGQGTFTSPGAEVLVGELKQDINGSTLMEDFPLVEFDRSANTTQDMGTVYLDTPIYLPPSSKLLSEITLPVAAVTAKQVKYLLCGYYDSKAPSAKKRG